MQQEKKSGTDVIQELLEDCLLAFPVSSMMISLYKQYGQRGFLTKKQMQGLHAKASSVPGMHTGRLATLEAIIRRMPNRFKSEKPKELPVEAKDTASGELILAILAKYPNHKQVLFLKSKYENNETLTPNELSELKRFAKLLV